MTIEERSTKIYHTQRMFSQEELLAREHRCVHEEPPYCNAACPLKLDTKALVRAIGNGGFSSALALYERITPLPHILAAGCEGPCRSACKLGEAGDAVDIPALERSAVQYGEQPKGRGLLRMKKKKTAAVFGSGLFVAFYIGEMAKKQYPLTVYSEFTDAASLLARAAPFAPAAAAADASLLTGGDITFVCIRSLTAEFFWEERQKYDLVALSPAFLKALGGIVDAAVMLWRAENIIAAQTDEDGVLPAAFGARKAALTADRLAQNLDPENSRGDEGTVATRLYTNMAGIEASRAVPCQGLYSKDEAQAEASRCIQCHCDECIRGCAYLQHYKKYPKKLTREIYNNAHIIMGDHMMNKPINACALCGQCTVTCPNGYDMAEICLQARRTMVASGKMPLAPHEFALLDMEFSNTEAFLCRPQPGYASCRYVFFPGCQASAIAPSTVEAAYEDLTKRLGGGVALMLGCCGAIAEWSGRDGLYAETQQLLDRCLDGLGRPVVIAACPTCASFLRTYEGLQVKGIWEVLEEAGLPRAGVQARGQAALHDACGARGDRRTQECIRSLARKLGYDVQETAYIGDASPCCGYGGLVMYANRAVAREMAAQCLARSELPYITYCMACRDRLAREGRPSHHILELVYGTDAGAPPDISEKRYNRLWLKERLLRQLWKEDDRSVDYGFTVTYTEEARQMMDDRMILTSDVMKTLQYLRETNEAIREGDTGLFLTRHRDGNVTFWVKYEERPGGYVVHRAYSHRMNVETR